MRTGTLVPLNLSSPLAASSAASAMTKASSLWPVLMSLRLSTEPPVTSAVASNPGTVLRQHVGEAAAKRIINAAGAAGRDRDRLLLLRGDRAGGKRGDERERDGRKFSYHRLILP